MFVPAQRRIDCEVTATIFWWCAIVSMSIGIIAVDIVTGPYIQFPIAFVIPVALGAWFISCATGIVFSMVLVGCRFAIEVALEQQVVPMWATAVNAGIQVAVLIVLAVAAAAVRERQPLARRLQILEGILPICMFCKKIRAANGKWQEIESYVTQHTAAQFSHGFCEPCGHKQYGEYFPSSGASK